MAGPEIQKPPGPDTGGEYRDSKEWSDWLSQLRNFAAATESESTMPDVRPFVDVTILGRKFLALVDSGAIVNLVGSKVARHMEKNGNFSERESIRLKMADGTINKTLYKYNIEGHIGSKPCVWEATYLHSLTTDLVIGMKTIKKLELLQFGDEIALFDDNIKSVAVEVNSLTVLSREEQSKLEEFLERELPLFDQVPGKTHLIEHTIRLKEGVMPIKQRYYPRNPKMQGVIDQSVKEMLEDGVIEPSVSPWSSPVVLVKKSTGKYRFCVDMREVNAASEKDAYPLPRIDAILDKLRHARILSTLDLRRGYWQVPLAEESRPITAFTVPGLGLYQFKAMPFGLHSAGATFQRLLDQVIGPELEPEAFAYLDDLVLISQSLDQHLKLLKTVFEKLRAAGLQINKEKCNFAKRELRYLGHVISQDGIATDPDKVRAIKEYRRPVNLKTLRTFLGMASWYRKFIKDFASVSAPLRWLLKKGTSWKWEAEQEVAFEALKSCLISAPILACPNFEETLVLRVDASNEGLGAALTQVQDGKDVVIAYASRLLNERERVYSTTEKECLALVWGISRFRPYVEGYHFIAESDHVAVGWLMKQKDPTGRLARWVMKLQQFDFEVRYRKGTQNRLADALSRSGPEQREEVETAAVVHDRPTAKTAGPERAVSQTESKHLSLDTPMAGGKPQEGWYSRLLDGVRRKPNKFPSYCIKDGKLLRLAKSRRRNGALWKMCIPPEDVPKVLQERHDDPCAGHMGTRKTLARVENEYYWPGWRRAVKEYVRSCLQCQQYKVEQAKPAGKMFFRRPQGPWVTLAADIIGPLPRSQRGRRYIVVFQDQFSKWVEVTALGAATARSVSAAFEDTVLLRFGAPEIILTDNGTQFTSRLFKEVAAEWGIECRTTAPYSPQSNFVERANRVIKTMLAQYVRENHKTWDQNLKKFQFAVNSAVQESSGFSPAKLCFGREMKLPRAISGQHFEVSDEENPVRAEVIYRERERQFKEIYDKCHKNLRAAYNRQSKYYNLRRREVTYDVGDRVMRRIHTLSSAADAIASKLAPKYQGPCEVSSRKGTNIYVVRDESTNQSHAVHVKDLKPYYARDLRKFRPNPASQSVAP